MDKQCHALQLEQASYHKPRLPFHISMRVVISGTASARLSRVQCISLSDTTFEAGVLTCEEIDAAFKGSTCTQEVKSASDGSISRFHGNDANELGSLGHPDPSAVVLLRPRDLCACGLFSCDIVQVTICGVREAVLSTHMCLHVTCTRAE